MKKTCFAIFSIVMISLLSLGFLEYQKISRPGEQIIDEIAADFIGNIQIAAGDVRLAISDSEEQRLVKRDLFIRRKMRELKEQEPTFYRQAISRLEENRPIVAYIEYKTSGQLDTLTAQWLMDQPRNCQLPSSQSFTITAKEMERVLCLPKEAFPQQLGESDEVLVNWSFVNLEDRLNQVFHFLVENEMKQMVQESLVAEYQHNYFLGRHIKAWIDANL